MVGACDCGNELSGFIKCGEFLNYLRKLKLSGRSVLYGVGYVNRYIHCDISCTQYGL